MVGKALAVSVLYWSLALFPKIFKEQIIWIFELEHYKTEFVSI